jgi:hypothetical protein
MENKILIKLKVQNSDGLSGHYPSSYFYLRPHLGE